MEIKKTTLLSALVCVAGVLAEIIFHDILSGSMVGVILSILLSVIVLSAAYFVMDGIYSFLTADREVSKKHQEEYERRIYSILNEQLQFEKAIYKEVRTLQQMIEDLNNVEKEMIVPMTASVEEARIPEEVLEKLTASINDNTMMTAKIIAKYVNRNTEELRELLEKRNNELQILIKEINNSAVK